jgi:ABC-type glycerol-3-phosphate transport system substrate-binding protein
MSQEGYNVKVLITKNGETYDILRTNVVNALKGGSLPNIVQNYPDHVVEYNKSGAIASLTPYIKHPVWGLDETKADEKFTDILESYRAEQRATNDQGDYLSLPFNKSTEVAVYNKTLFDAVLRGRPFPETWQDLQELYPDIMRVKDNVIDQIAERWAAANKPLTADEISKAKSQFVPFAYDSSANAFITLTRQFGGAYTSRDSNGKGKLEFDSPQVRAMLNYFGSKENGHWFAVPPQWEVQYANNVSNHGTTAFSVGSTGGVRYNTPVESGFELFEIGVAPVPYDKYSPESKAAIQQGTNMSLTTQGTPEERLISWLFIKYLMSTEIQTRFAIATGYSPVRNSIYSTQAFLDYVATADEVMPKSYIEAGLSVKDYQAKYELKVKAMASKVQETQRKYLFYDTPFIGSSATRDAVGVAFDRVILNKNDSELAQAIENAIAFAVAEAMKTIGN